MSATSRHSKDSSRRRSIFALTGLRSTADLHDGDDGSRPSKKSKTLLSKKPKHTRSPSLFVDVNHPDVARETGKSRLVSDQPRSQSRRPSLSMRGSKRPPSVFESLKTSLTRGSSEDLLSVGHGYTNGEPNSTTSSKAPSLVFDHVVDANGSASPGPSKMVLLHGEVQTSAGMFRKKKEYLVLTEYAILRYKTQAKAAEHFRTIPSAAGRSPVQRHGSMPSAGSHSDLQTLSDSSGDKDGRVLLRQIVATLKVDDGKPYFALEVAYLDEESGSASVMTLQFGNPEERDGWLVRIRSVANEIRQRETTFISPYNLENVARIVERDNDYDPENCAIYKVVQRQPAVKSGSRSSSDDLTKVASTVCFLAIGVHKVHLIPLVKPAARTSSPSLTPNHSQASYGILTLVGVKVSGEQDTFELVFRQPLQKPRVLHLAAASSFEIAARLHWSENFLRPECGHRLFKFKVPTEVDDLLVPPADPGVEEHNCLDRTLIAYCVAYGVNPSNIRYTINYSCEDGPRFELLSPADRRRPNYGPLELLAIMRAIRYNESFGSLSFAGVLLDSLNGLHDNYGTEHVCTRTKRGTPIKLTAEELSRSSLLVQEVRAIAATSKKLRRMDFSGCVTVKHSSATPTEEEPIRNRDIGSGVVEALFPLCKHQTTNVDWICLNGIELSETDQDYLVGAAVDKSCHFRAIELNRCGLNDRSLGLILDALRAQENTLESLEIAGNAARLSPAAFDSQLGMFGFIRKLNLSNVSRTSGTEPFIQAETLLVWRLQELRLTGTTLNAATIDAISTYLAHPQSASLHELYLDKTYLTGGDVATLLHSMSWDSQRTRDMHLDISQCVISKGLEKVTQAISSNLAPSHLSMRAVEYKEESMFRKVLRALTTNRVIRFLDISQTALPGDASEETCDAIAHLLAENDTIVELNISGEDARLATSKFGPGINEALAGLKENTSIQVFKVEKQKLGIRGASTLAEVLRLNRTLLELHCDNNEIPLHGLTDLVNALTDNTALIYLPPMDDGRAAAFKMAEVTMRTMSDLDPPRSPTGLKTSHHQSAVRKGFANVRKTTSRAASNYTPSFPALGSYGRSSPSPDARSASPLSLTIPTNRKAAHSPSGSTSSQLSPFTIQDVQTTHRLLTEQWDRQCYRLEQYLHRNWCMLNNVPAKMEIEDEIFERPSSVGSIGKMLEQVKFDTTPKADLEGRSDYFDSSQDGGSSKPIDFPTPRRMPASSSSGAPQISPIDESKHGMSFKHFVLDGTASPTSANRASEDSQTFRSISGNMRPLRIDTTMSDEEPRTPTQGAFIGIDAKS
ncbi:Putative pleckstrin domain, leucine-rich repeat domain superfamily [Septoria linicola]|uniref:Pleckstrin domain, leucine-rich repeat domain superfamily n=1 Tax=Septoria linicola TaxID=215465 RepID=A0A9Q9ANE4_9PEZI|nr:Putative pleckstrin domain, leucine-rich repeat domain superfamily [Septoria linicola]